MNKLLMALLKGSVILLGLIILAVLLSPKPDIKSTIPYSKAFFDRDGNLLRLTLAKDQRYRLFENLDQISPELIQATILYEDQSYYDHFGVDPIAIIRAFWATYVTQGRRIGASTIVMQLARLRWHIPSNTIIGKLEQMMRALQLSRHYSKGELLEAYLNLTPYGRNIEGIGAASLIYFNKKASELSTIEALTLAVIPQNPNKRNPTSSRGYQHLSVARSVLFQRWLELHPEDKSKARYLNLDLKIRAPEQLPFEAPHFVNYVNQQQSEWDNGNIKTTLSLKKQHAVEQVLSDYVEANAANGIRNASALLLNYKTMAIEAMVGSADFNNAAIFGQVNGTNAKRSPGSTLKPFVYGLAIDEGLVHPLTLLKDAPRRFGGFTPENYDKQFLGPISVKDALIQSRNVPAVSLQSQLTHSSLYKFLQQAGVSDLKSEDYYGLALALGGGEVTSIELASLYAVLANGGEYRSVKTLMSEKSIDSKRLLSPEASYLILNILKDNPAPDALGVNFELNQNNDIAWKTGTSWAFRDAWAVGISGDYVLVVWVGNFDGKGNDTFIGRSAAGPLFFKIWQSVFPPQNWHIDDAMDPESLNLKRVELCANTGDLYQKLCPSSVESWFIPGISPIKSSNIYRRLPIDKATGLRACYYQPGKTELKVYEFWPSDFIELFNRAGISLKSPPHYATTCSLQQTSASGVKPVITSPQSTISYVTDLNNQNDNPIPLKAIVDPDVRLLHWFINNQFIGTARRGQVLTWYGQPGTYQAQIVDDAGRSSSRSFTIVNSAQ